MSFGLYWRAKPPAHPTTWATLFCPPQPHNQPQQKPSNPSLAWVVFFIDVFWTLLVGKTACPPYNMGNAFLPTTNQPQQKPSNPSPAWVIFFIVDYRAF
ncbi:MAG: hypothetical protein PHG00_03565 [Methylococcales bacterium]|nr:hypothetical protein [Methylococcales bacterium]